MKKAFASKSLNKVDAKPTKVSTSTQIDDPEFFVGKPMLSTRKVIKDYPSLQPIHTEIKPKEKLKLKIKIKSNQSIQLNKEDYFKFLPRLEPIPSNLKRNFLKLRRNNNNSIEDSKTEQNCQSNSLFKYRVQHLNKIMIEKIYWRNLFSKPGRIHKRNKSYNIFLTPLKQ